MDLAAILAHIEANLAGDLSLGTLARHCQLSSFQFHRAFRARVGEPPRRYVRRLRLERAAVCLKLGSQSVTDVAFGAGYATHAAFTRAFHAHFGVSPQHYRALLKAHDVPPDFSPRIVRQPTRRIAFLRHVGPYASAERAFERLAAWAAPRGLLSEAMLAVYLDDQDVTPPERTRCDVALFVSEHVRSENEIRLRDLPGGDFAVFSHAGDVPGRRRLYEVVFRSWLPSIGRRPSGAPPYELYRFSGDGLGQLAAHIHVPLAPR